ncbi:hypothetical protein TNIN_320101 [Trichonephila inaurata madagascariensis]|uniref:Uncharacterized protein n=1 Tax=Trichonephila inaurata madagascariensis TaxID=2747483 RepID=A0A8X6X623_9ARAC|nr:hypothetical protein TNIN_320101 [Trichonephila inaurata madagascariensis]
MPLYAEAKILPSSPPGDSLDCSSLCFRSIVQRLGIVNTHTRYHPGNRRSKSQLPWLREQIFHLASSLSESLVAVAAPPET